MHIICVPYLSVTSPVLCTVGCRAPRLHALGKSRGYVTISEFIYDRYLPPSGAPWVRLQHRQHHSTHVPAAAAAAAAAVAATIVTCCSRSRTSKQTAMLLQQQNQLCVSGVFSTACKAVDNYYTSGGRQHAMRMY
jgi:hypothetical protein